MQDSSGNWKTIASERDGVAFDEAGLPIGRVGEQPSVFCGERVSILLSSGKILIGSIVSIGGRELSISTDAPNTAPQARDDWIRVIEKSFRRGQIITAKQVECMTYLCNTAASQDEVIKDLRKQLDDKEQMIAVYEEAARRQAEKVVL